MPIFAGGDWLEATGLNHELRALTRKAIGQDEVHGIPLGRDAVSTKYDLLPRPERFDDAVRAGAALIAYQRAFGKICEDSEDCRRRFLKWTILPNILPKISLVPDEDLLDRFKVLRDGTVDIPSQRLKDHNPIQKSAGIKFSSSYRPDVATADFELISAWDTGLRGRTSMKFLVFARAMGRAFFLNLILPEKIHQGGSDKHQRDTLQPITLIA